MCTKPELYCKVSRYTTRHPCELSYQLAKSPFFNRYTFCGVSPKSYDVKPRKASMKSPSCRLREFPFSNCKQRRRFENRLRCFFATLFPDICYRIMAGIGKWCRFSFVYSTRYGQRRNKKRNFSALYKKPSAFLPLIRGPPSGI